MGLLYFLSSRQNYIDSMFCPVGKSAVGLCSAWLTLWVRRWTKTKETDLKLFRGDACCFSNQQNQVPVQDSKKGRLLDSMKDHVYLLTEQVTVLVLVCNMPLKTCQPRGKGNIMNYIHIKILFK